MPAKSYTGGWLIDDPPVQIRRGRAPKGPRASPRPKSGGLGGWLIDHLGAETDPNPAGDREGVGDTLVWGSDSPMVSSPSQAHASDVDGGPDLGYGGTMGASDSLISHVPGWRPTIEGDPHTIPGLIPSFLGCDQMVDDLNAHVSAANASRAACFNAGLPIDEQVAACERAVEEIGLALDMLDQYCASCGHHAAHGAYCGPGAGSGGGLVG